MRGTYRVVTSKTAQRTLLNTFLITVTSAALYAASIVAFLLFYHNYLPDQVATVPVHLQYGYVARSDRRQTPPPQRASTAQAGHNAVMASIPTASHPSQPQTSKTFKPTTSP